MTSSASISGFGERLRKGLVQSEVPVPAGQMYHSIEHCVVANFVEGCTIGGGIGVLVSVLPAMLKGRFATAGNSIVTVGNIRVALFFGSLMTICNTGVYIQCSSEERDQKKERRLRLLIGLLSGLSVVVLPKSIRRFIVFFLLTRSLEVGARLAKARYLERKTGVDESTVDNPLPAVEDLFTVHEIVGLTCASMTVIITGWFRFRELVPHAYLHFLHSINNLSQEEVANLSIVLRRECETKNPALTHIYTSSLCQTIHDPGQQCLDFFVRFLLKGIFTRTGPFYLKLYSVPLVISLVRRKGKISEEFVKQFANRVFRSALFLATMNATVAGTACFLGHHVNFLPQLVQMALSGAACGLSLYIEQEPRRLELALYLFGQALQILLNAYSRQGWWTPRGTDIVVSASSIALVTHAFWQREEQGQLALLRPGYAGLLGKILDTKFQRHGFKL